ncbi:hypothetical protein [Nonomuraea sp. NPDC003804]|uniref:hypothetical protein n=1 Tax=Nonomuraea sp. NPDC003804 TaxID=3154547 RepID=UPI0033B3F589
MTAELATSPLIVDAFPEGAEVAIIAVPAGGVVRVHYESGAVVTFAPLLSDEPAIAVVPGDKDKLRWGCVPGWYTAPKWVGNDQHQQDKPVWKAAMSALCRGAEVAYVKHELQTYYSGERWAAVSFRAGDEPAAGDEQTGAAA